MSMRRRIGSVALVLTLLGVACMPGQSWGQEDQRIGTVLAVEGTATVRVANATTVQYRLTCAPPSGTVPDPEAACRRLSADPAILAVRSRCFLPDTGSNVVKGELDGRPVDIRLVRGDRFDAEVRQQLVARREGGNATSAGRSDGGVHSGSGFPRVSGAKGKASSPTRKTAHNVTPASRDGMGSG